MKVRRIPARHEGKRKRVAAYCRVSTKDAAQEESFETQVAHYTQYIAGNPNWAFVRIYATMASAALACGSARDFWR